MSKKKIDRVGEISVNNQGLKMKIIKYVNNNDITVEFEDGSIAEHKKYYRFKEGGIAHPNHTTLIDRTGETGINNQGLKMEIVKYITSNDITIKFEDDSIVKHRTYRQFKEGSIMHPDYTKIIDRTGETNVNNQGLTMTIVEYKTCKDITVQFEDGTIVEYRKYNDFKKGRIALPNYTQFIDRTGEVGTNNQGLNMKIVKYNGCSDISIKFEDGALVEHAQYSAFKNGEIAHPSYTQIIDRTGEVNINTQGLKMEIIEYINNVNITVRFDDGTVVKNKHYGAFREGKITNHNAPMSSESRGERLVKDYLENNNIKYEQEYILHGCKYKQPLRFDFAVFDGDSLISLIEFDGEQHYKPVRFRGISEEKAEELFKLVQLRDKIKTDYCKDNNIKLIRIPYWEANNITDILNRCLK